MNQKYLLVWLLCTLFAPTATRGTYNHQELATAVTTFIQKFVKGIKNGTITFDVDEKAIAHFVSHLSDEQLDHMMGFNKRSRLEKKLHDIIPDVVKRLKKLAKVYADDINLSDERLQSINTLVADIQHGSKKIRIPAHVPLRIALMLSHVPGPLLQALLDMDIFNGK